MHDDNAYDKAVQLERDFGVPHPIGRLNSALRRDLDKRDIEPHSISVARDRLEELDARGFARDDGLVVLLMRGARLEVLARAIGHEVAALRSTLRRRVHVRGPHGFGEHIAESQRGLDLMRRA